MTKLRVEYPGTLAEAKATALTAVNERATAAVAALGPVVHAKIADASKNALDSHWVALEAKHKGVSQPEALARIRQQEQRLQEIEAERLRAETAIENATTTAEVFQALQG